ncbi:arylsulfatase [Chitinophaga sp. XS-30]|uniref:arylsulfatase n=1 Tax=Chitinophaga sp. XS-30 TaxID=2604421 RepID=UPI0011DCC758|nr:arylsulfatase [Chitinophaga sp. XS-30]QEH43424.1 arylsulfatase [Chitinophaga sp. XS-30]
MKQLLMLFLCINCSTIANAQQKPNIVFILADDLGYGDIGAYGQQKIKTPNLDRLAAQGMRFTSFYSGATVCAPSRSSLLTGLHTGHTYIRGNKEIQPEGQEPLADSVQSYALMLQRAGYATGAFGKWGLGMVGTSGAPDKKGFDTFFGYNCQRQSHRYYPTHLWDNNDKVVLEGNDLNEKKVYAPALIQERTLAFIETNKDRPFFLFIPSVLPHAELQGPEDAWYRMYEHRFSETPHRGNDYGPEALVAGYASVTKPRATFAAMVSRLDVYVGQVLDKLEELGLSDNTIVMFSSDNGPHEEGGADPGFFNSSGGFRGVKRDLYEGGIRVPFVVKWPGKVKAGSETAHPAAFWDLMPTFLEIAGAPPAGITDGISILPTLLGKGRQKEHRYLYWEFHESGGRQAVRAGKWKAVRLQLKNDPDKPLELYDLQEDPGEQQDIAARHPDIVKKMEQYMQQAHVESPLFPLTGGR